MKFELKHRLTKADKIGILRLWNAEYPVQLVHENLASLDNYLRSLDTAEHAVVKDGEKNIMGWLVRFQREQAIWFAIIISRQNQGIGIGTQLMELLPRDEQVNGWVVTDKNQVLADGQSYKTPVDFYVKMDFKLEEDVTLIKDGIKSTRIVRHPTTPSF
jgi:hypothetical protein